MGDDLKMVSTDSNLYTVFPFQALADNAYDHHTAIYFLLVDRLRQHRASYPLQTQLETRLRRPSGIAEAAVVRGSRNNVVVVPSRATQRTVPAQPARPYIPLQYAYFVGILYARMIS